MNVVRLTGNGKMRSGLNFKLDSRENRSMSGIPYGPDTKYGVRSCNDNTYHWQEPTTGRWYIVRPDQITDMVPSHFYKMQSRFGDEVFIIIHGNEDFDCLGDVEVEELVEEVVD